MGEQIDEYLLDASHIRHARNNHSDEEIEAANNQIALTEQDFLSIPEILLSSKTIVSPSKGKTGNSVKLLHSCRGGKLNLVITKFEIFVKGKSKGLIDNTMSNKTMYKKKINGISLTGLIVCDFLKVKATAGLEWD